jgi:hypothetical protein
MAPVQQARILELRRLRRVGKFEIGFEIKSNLYWAIVGDDLITVQHELTLEVNQGGGVTIAEVFRGFDVRVLPVSEKPEGPSVTHSPREVERARNELLGILGGTKFHANGNS